MFSGVKTGNTDIPVQVVWKDIQYGINMIKDLMIIIGYQWISGENVGHRLSSAFINIYGCSYFHFIQNTVET